MKSFFDVLFEISNEDRFRILVQIVDEPMNVTRLSNKLGLSLTETSRHLSRILDVGLVVRDPDGYYRIDNFGMMLLSQLGGIEFVTNNREYFRTHSVTRLPPEFISRIGDLKNSTPVTDPMVFFHSVANGMQEAKEYIQVLVDQFVMSHVPILKEALERNIATKTIEPKVWVAPPSFYRIREEAEKSWLKKAREANILEHRSLDVVDVYVHMSEREAALAFPTAEGRYDYLGFTCTDKKSLKFCSDLFDYYWKKAEPLIDPLRNFDP